MYYCSISMYGRLLVCTVRPVYKGHSMDPENLPFMRTCP